MQKTYVSIMISRIVVSIAPAKDKEQTIDPGDLKTLTDYFYGSIRRLNRRCRSSASQAPAWSCCALR